MQNPGRGNVWLPTRVPWNLKELHFALGVIGGESGLAYRRQEDVVYVLLPAALGLCLDMRFVDSDMHFPQSILVEIPYYTVILCGMYV